jgi:hypothetical protein
VRPVWRGVVIYVPGTGSREVLGVQNTYTHQAKELGESTDCAKLVNERVRQVGQLDLAYLKPKHRNPLIYLSSTPEHIAVISKLLAHRGSGGERKAPPACGSRVLDPGRAIA